MKTSIVPFNPPVSRNYVDPYTLWLLYIAGMVLVLLQEYCAVSCCYSFIQRFRNKGVRFIDLIWIEALYLQAYINDLYYLSRLSNTRLIEHLQGTKRRSYRSSRQRLVHSRPTATRPTSVSTRRKQSTTNSGLSERAWVCARNIYLYLWRLIRVLTAFRHHTETSLTLTHALDSQQHLNLIEEERTYFKTVMDYETVSSYSETKPAREKLIDWARKYCDL